MHRREIRSYFLWIEILKTVCWRKRAELPLFSFLLCGIAVLPCFSASGKVPVTRCGLPLRGTYAAYVQFPLRLSRAHARLRPRKHFKRFHQSRQGGRIPTRSFQQALSFSVRRSAYSHIIRELPGLWQGRLGIEPTQAVLETASPALEHSPLYPAFTDSSRSLLRVLSNARFNAGKSNGPSRSHALLTGQIWTHPAGNGFPALSPCTLSALGLGADGWTRTSDQWHSIAYPFAR